MGAFEQAWRRRFEDYARDYDADHLISGWSPSGLDLRLARFSQILERRKVRTPALTLDVGCGAGTYVRRLGSVGHRVIGFDYSLSSLHRAVATDSAGVGHYTAGEAYRLPFRDGCFDVVLSVGVLQTLAEPERLVDEMTRVLCRRGLLVLDFLNAYEVVSLVKTAGERLLGTRARVHTYAPAQVRNWLVQRGLRHIERIGIYLPPPRVPFIWIATLLQQRRFTQVLESLPGVSLLGAHAFFLVGQKNET